VVAVFANRISAYSTVTTAPATSVVPPGFAVCPLAQGFNNPLALQLLAQQQAYEQALVAAREEALRIALSRLQTSLN
jgi:hypothetical protein